MSRIIVTGGLGFIGSSLVEKLSQNSDNQIFVIDDLSTGFLDNKIESDRVKYFDLDICDQESLTKIFEKSKPDFVFHLAAVVGVERTLANPFSVFSDIKAMVNILEACVKYKVKRIYYSSSSEVYGEPVESPQKESSPINAKLPYAAVKYISELYCKSYFDEFGLEYTIFRFFNTFGPNQSKDFVMSVFINQAIRNEPLTVIGDGKQKRTFCYIEENLNAVLECFYGNKFVCDVINIGSQQEYSIFELANLVIELSNSSSTIKFIDRRLEGDVKIRCPNLDKMNSLMVENISVRDGIINMINHFKKSKNDV